VLWLSPPKVRLSSVTKETSKLLDRRREIRTGEPSIQISNPAGKVELLLEHGTPSVARASRGPTALRIMVIERIEESGCAVPFPNSPPTNFVFDLSSSWNAE
jgi:hypothetical protein